MVTGCFFEKSMGIVREIEKVKKSNICRPAQNTVLNIFSPKVRGGSSGESVSSIVGIPCVSESRAVNNRRLFITVHNRTHRDKVHFLGAPEGRAHVQIPAEPETEEDGDVDVTRDEVLRIPHEEVLIAVDEDEDRRPEYAPDGEPGLQRVVVRELGEVAALRSVSAP
jgi:hypothetical protein